LIQLLRRVNATTLGTNLRAILRSNRSSQLKVGRVYEEAILPYGVLKREQDV